MDSELFKDLFPNLHSIGKGKKFRIKDNAFREEYPVTTAFLEDFVNEIKYGLENPSTPIKELTFEEQLRRERQNYEVTKELLDIRHFLK